LNNEIVNINEIIIQMNIMSGLFMESGWRVEGYDGEWMEGGGL